MASQNSVTTLDDQRRFIRRAIDLSYIGACTKRVGEPFGAVIVKDGKIIGEGYNMMTMNSDPTAHGEIVAIRNTCESIKSLDLSGCHMYSSCEPCLMCASAILLTGVECIYYAATLEEFNKYLTQTDYKALHSYYTIPKPQIFGKIAERIFDEKACEVYKQWSAIHQD